MELRHLSGFVAVSEELHFGRAAKRLHLSQPAVSRLVRTLEKELGVTLLDRSTHHVELTPAGQAFLIEVRVALDQVDAAARAARQAAAAVPAPLRIGFTECTEELLPRALRSFRRQLPPVRLDVRQLDRDAQVQQLVEGEVDVVIRRIPIEHTTLQTELVMREPMMVALPARHTLAQQERLSVGGLAGARFVLLPRALYPQAHDRLLMLCEHAGFVPDVAEEGTSLTSVTVLVAAGVGVSIVPASISARFNLDEIVYRPLEDPTPTLPVVVSWRRSDSSPALHRFLDALRSLRPVSDEQQAPQVAIPAAASLAGG